MLSSIKKVSTAVKCDIVVPIQFRSAAILAATREQDAPTTFRLLFFIWNHYKNFLYLGLALYLISIKGSLK